MIVPALPTAGRKPRAVSGAEGALGVQYSQRPRREEVTINRKLSLVWRWLGFVIIGFALFTWGSFLWDTSGPRDGRIPCLSNLKQLALGQLMYEDDNNDRLPQATAWMDAIEPEIETLHSHDTPDLAARERQVFHCPALNGKDEYGYAMNFELSGKDTKALPRPESQVLLFDSVLLVRNACSGVYGFPDASRHNGRYYAAFLDGHAKGFRIDQEPAQAASPVSAGTDGRK
jgi:prepilin-type processing-associated H-X9-DG protein